MPDWRDEALCRDYDPELWFSTSTAERRAAIDICSRCPVAPDCLLYALATGQQFGIWGGTDFEEPRRAARAEYVKRGRPARSPKSEKVYTPEYAHSTGRDRTEIRAASGH